MTPEQISIICKSFEKVLSEDPDFGAKFYQRLSSDFPETKKIFSNVNMESQHTRFVSMLEIILNRMKTGYPVIPLLRDLGQQHDKYGVVDEHFKNFGATLINVLQEFLDSDFDDQLRKAWSEVYMEITSVMTSAGHLSRQ